MLLLTMTITSHSQILVC